MVSMIQSRLKLLNKVKSSTEDKETDCGTNTKTKNLSTDESAFVLARISTERRLFKHQMLLGSPLHIYDNCNKIQFYECLYEYFKMNYTKLPVNFLSTVRYDTAILSSLYHHYLKNEHLSCLTWADIQELLQSYTENLMKVGA